MAKAHNKKEHKIIIDVDYIIKKYNDANPKKSPISRESLAKELNVNKQLFTDWKAGKGANVIPRLQKLMEIGKCKLEDFVTVQD